MNTSSPRLIKLDYHLDDRGFLLQAFGGYEAEFPSLKRIYLVGNFSRGTIRGFHLHKKETKGYVVLRGAAKFVIVASSGEQLSFVLTPLDANVLLVGPNNNQGWISLEDDTLVLGLSDKSLEQSQKDDVRIDPFAFGKSLWETKPR